MLSRRSLSTISLLIPLLLSSWSNVIAAAFCPRYLSNRDCRITHLASLPKQVRAQQSCHHEMADMVGMEMDDMQMGADTSSDSQSAPTQWLPAQSTLNSSTDQVVFDLPLEECAHCWSHSQPRSGGIAIVAVDPSRQVLETEMAPAASGFLPTFAFHTFIAPSEHGPPGTALRRHILISLFRI